MPKVAEHFNNEAIFTLMIASKDINVESTEAGRAIFCVNHHKTPHFIERPELLKKIHDLIEANEKKPKLITLCGLGGMGKSQIALDFCYQSKDLYQYIFWMEADAETTLQSSFIAVAEELKLPNIANKNPENVVCDVLKWFQDNSEWLLVFDNADDYSLNSEFSCRLRDKYFPKSGRGVILITTCLKWKIGQSGTAIDINEMILDNKAALRLLLRDKTTVNENDEDALKIVEELGHLPLALDLAGAIMDMSGSTPSKFLRNYKECLDPDKYILQRSANGYGKTVYTVWNASLDRIKIKNSLAVSLIQTIAFLYPDNVPLGLFERHYQIILQNGEAISHSSLQTAVGFLVDYSFVRRSNHIENKQNKANDTLSVHRLVQSAIRFKVNLQDRLKICKRLFSAIYMEVSDQSLRIMETYAPHIRLLIDQIISLAGDQFDIVQFSKWAADQADFSKELMSLLSPTIVYLTSRHLFEGVEKLAQLDILVSKEVNGTKHQSTAKALCNLAYFYMNQNRFEYAERPCTLAWKIHRMILGHRHEDTISAVHELAFIYRKRGEEILATQMYWEAATVGDLEAQIELSYRYREGIKAPKHVGLAHFWKCRSHRNEFPESLAAQRFSYSNKSIRKYFTPLHLAVLDAHIEGITNITIYQKFAKIRDRNGRTALHLAAKYGNASLVESMVNELGIDTGEEDNYGQIALHLAAESGKLEVVKLLVNVFGSDINAKDKDGRLPLSLAVRNQHKDVVKLLLIQYRKQLNLKGMLNYQYLAIIAVEGLILLTCI